MNVYTTNRRNECGTKASYLATIRAFKREFQTKVPRFLGHAADVSGNGGGKPAANIKIDGRSFAPQLQGQKGEPREWVYVELGGQKYIRDPRWKLTGKDELFDMKDAPFKQLAVAVDNTDQEAKAARERLKAAMAKLTTSEAGATVIPKKKKKD